MNSSKRKVLLLTPPYPLAERLGKLGILGGRLPSISLLYLAAALRDICDVTIIDASCSDLSETEVLEQIARFNPDIVGISSVTPAISRAQKIAESIKLLLPGTLIVLGGPHITTVPHETMLRTPAVDVGVVGEGELTIQEIIKAYDGTMESLRGIPGTILRLVPDTPLLMNPVRELVQNIDDFGLPAYDLIDSLLPVRPAIFKTRKMPAIHAITSRGCTHSCTYCNTNLFNKRVRFHSADYVIKLIRYLMAAGYKEIAFEDDNFTAHKQRLVEICRYLIDNNVPLSWSVNARIDTVDEELLRLMKRAGCWYISYGIESGSQETLDRVNKKITLEEIRTKLEITRRVGIEAKGFFIVGFPWENESMIQTTIDFALSLRLSDLNIFPLTPFPGTDVYEQAKMIGSFDDDWAKMDLQRIVYIPEGLSARFLQDAIRKLLLRFYLRPKIVINYFCRFLEARDVFIGAVRELLHR